MGIFRKRAPREEPPLEKLLDGYQAKRPPAATHSMVESIICWRCRKPNVFDARLPAPKNCAWCRAAF